ncbi:MAG TPA: precorrin-8X methylmutase [Deltaproteobacteria bacterium]|nr:precorrin-8X methylmutase [Deltaproteobacteria bacterium]HQB39256.1 precorrin-8X methylmutase [Deltaproteobacteria bacterium]
MTETDKRRPLVRDLYENRLSGEQIEKLSFQAIDQLAPAHGFDKGQWEVVRRMIHTVADFNIMDIVRFSGDAIEAGIAALKAGSPIYCDSNMIKNGLSLAKLSSISDRYTSDAIRCHVADADVAAEATATGLPRSLYAMRKARPIADGGILLFGNAPVALLELNRMIIEEGVRPALVMAMPVGFVHVVESKEELMSLGVPYVAMEGRRGGSPLAVAALHAICSLAKAKGGQ